jgi:hypothetical protein
MAAAIADLSYIPKGRSKGVTYEFRGIDAVMNHLHPVLATHGLYLSPRVLDDWQVNLIPGSPDSKGNARQQSQALFRVAVDVYGADGSSVTLGPGLAQSHDYGDKAVYQAQQNAIKYVLLEAFCIPTAEPDMDGREADPVAVDTSRLETLLTEAAELGVELDADEARRYAAPSQERADKMAERVAELLKDARRNALSEASGAGVEEAPSGDPAPERKPDVDWTKPDPGQEVIPSDGEGSQAKLPSPDTDTPQEDDTYNWRGDAKDRGLGIKDVLPAIRARWPWLLEQVEDKDRGMREPRHGKDIDTTAEKYPELVATVIAEVAA